MGLTYRELMQATQRVKEELPYGQDQEPGRAPELIETHWLQITSTTLTSGYYPAKRYNIDADGKTFTDPTDVCWIWAPNTQDHLGTGIYYACRLIGLRSADGVAVYSPLIAGHTGKLRGKLDATLNQGSSATMSVWEYNGSAEADTGENVTVYDWLLSGSQSIASGKKVTAYWDAGSSRWYVDAAECA